MRTASGVKKVGTSSSMVLVVVVRAMWYWFSRVRISEMSLATFARCYYNLEGTAL